MAARFLGTRCSGIRAAQTIGRLISLPSAPHHQAASKKLPLFPAGSVSAPNQKCVGISFSRGIVATRAAYDEAPPAEEEEPKRKIFVGNLPWSVTVQELGDFFFDACGPVSDVYIPVDRNSGRPKGIGFVEFEDQASAAEAVANLGGTDLGGRSLVVEFAGKPARAPRDNFRYQDDGEPQPPTDRIFVSSLSYDTTWESLKDFFKAAGNVTYASVSERPDGSSKGCGVVQFETIEEAQGAIEMMNGADLDGRTINVREDRQRGGRDRRQPRQGSASWGRMQERGAPEMRPGDWTCPSCGAHVFASKQNCFRCQEPKPAGAGASDGGGWDY